MKQWNFYFSGILYGIIRDQNEDGKELNHQTLDVFTNTFNREEPFHNDDFYEVLCRRKIRRFFESLPEYETHAPVAVQGLRFWMHCHMTENVQV